MSIPIKNIIVRNNVVTTVFLLIILGIKVFFDRLRIIIMSVFVKCG